MSEKGMAYKNVGSFLQHIPSLSTDSSCMHQMSVVKHVHGLTRVSIQSAA